MLYFIVTFRLTFEECFFAVCRLLFTDIFGGCTVGGADSTGVDSTKDFSALLESFVELMVFAKSCIPL